VEFGRVGKKNLRQNATKVSSSFKKITNWWERLSSTGRSVYNKKYSIRLVRME
jgi:hypothetical protein